MLKQRLEFAREVHGQVLEWYRVADRKAEMALTVLGALIALLAGASFGNPAEVEVRTSSFGWDTWVFISVSAGAAFLATTFAALCLRSRLGTAAIRNAIERAAVDRTTSDGISNPISDDARVGYWFGTLAVIDEGRAERLLRSGDAEFEISALASESVVLSRNVLSKHRWVNRSWTMLAASIATLLATAVSYLAHL